MSKQRKRSKDSARVVDLEVGGVLAGLGAELSATTFNGHAALEGQATVVALLRGGDSVSSINAGVTSTYWIFLCKALPNPEKGLLVQVMLSGLECACEIANALYLINLIAIQSSKVRFKAPRPVFK